MVEPDDIRPQSSHDLGDFFVDRRKRDQTPQHPTESTKCERAGRPRGRPDQLGNDAAENAIFQRKLPHATNARLDDWQAIQIFSPAANM